MFLSYRNQSVDLLANHLIGFYMMGTLVVKGLINSTLQGKLCGSNKRRPSLTGEIADSDNELPTKRSKTEQYGKTVYITFQKPGGCTCKVELKETGKTMLSVAQKLNYKSFFFVFYNNVAHKVQTIPTYY